MICLCLPKSILNKMSKAMTKDILRIIDANLNRATEGLRVVEDVFRYGLDDSRMQQKLKTLRHRLASAVDFSPFIAARNALSDVGFEAKGALENKRSSLKDILRANIKRVQEALRVLEEMLKLHSPETSGVMKEIRYACYEIEREMELMGKKTIAKGLYLILTDPPQGYGKMAEMAVSKNIPAVQLRYKGSNSRLFMELACTLREITRGSETLLIINDRVDIALLAQADGVHLGQGDISPVMARRLAGDQLIIGLSTHTLAQVEQAGEEPVDYIGFGPVFTPFSKENPEPVTGVEMLKTAVGLSKIPVVAIGGITCERLESFAGIPCRNIACIGAVAMSQDPAEEMKAINTKSGEIL